jgi:uncharacterized protein
MLLERDAQSHQQAREFVRVAQVEFLIPQVALTETAFLFNRKGGVPAVSHFLTALLVLKFAHPAVTEDDLARAREIMLAYPTSRLDFVDCCIAALAERMNISQICTYDRRDFGIIRPRHVESFVLLP